ncbi:MAG: OmpA family protein [Cytophagales bacterium]|nr:MAG: OmpA family protein [Cytophagales bacterium]
MQKYLFFLCFILIFSHSILAQRTDIKTVANAESVYAKTKLGTQVNSVYYEGQPVVSADGKYLFVYRVAHPKNVGITPSNARDEDIWIATLQADGSFSEMQNIGSPLNTGSNNAILGISGDGNTLFLYDQYNINFTEGVTNIATSERTIAGWSSPKSIRIKGFSWKTDVAWMSISVDKRILLISYANNSTTFGKQDIYVSFLGADGLFSEPLNLGSGINTAGIDGSPFLAADNVTLYFSTDGRKGYGNLDVFVCKRLDDSWQKWSEPLNLGSKVNTPNWDCEFTMTAKGNVAYFSSGGQNYGENADVFKVEIQDAARPEPVGMVFGKVLNRKTNEPINTAISYTDLKTNKNVGTASADPKDGSYKIYLPKDKSYSYFAEKEGFFSIKENIDLTGLKTYTEIEKNIYLVPIEAGTSIQLNNLFFVQSKAILLPTSNDELNQLLDMMKTYPSMVIEIAGHTDNVGIPKKNLVLSQERAKKVKEYLVENGIREDRIKTVGYGGAKPIANNASEETRKQNRRVEFKILEK